MIAVSLGGMVELRKLAICLVSWVEMTCMIDDRRCGVWCNTHQHSSQRYNAWIPKGERRHKRRQLHVVTGSHRLCAYCKVKTCFFKSFLLLKTCGHKFICLTWGEDAAIFKTYINFEWSEKTHLHKWWCIYTSHTHTFSEFWLNLDSYTKKNARHNFNISGFDPDLRIE